MNSYLCRTCLSVKPESQFYIGHSKSRCKTCTVAKVREHVTRINDDLREQADHHKERWTNEEIATLLEGVEAGTPFQELAVELGRTYRAVMTKADAVRRVLEFTGAPPTGERRNQVKTCPVHFIVLTPSGVCGNC